MTAFSLKILAILGMTADHIAVAFDERIPYIIKMLMYFCGGITFPIMAHFFVEGYHKTRNRFKYALRLFIFACISIVPFNMAFAAVGTSVLNVLFTFLLGMLSLFLYEKQKNRFLFGISFTLIILVSLICDWAIMGVCLILAFGTIKTENWKRIFYPLLCTSAFMNILSLIEYAITGEINFLNISFSGGILASTPLILSYNNQRGYNLKYFFYIYYPLHLSIIAYFLHLQQG